MNKLVPMLLLALLVLAGCGPGGPFAITTTGQLPVITSFNASPSNISAGQSSTLDWTVSGATTVSIDQGIGNVALTGTRAVVPTATTVYTLTAYSSAGSVTATTQVIVSGATPTGLPVINSFIASPSSITVGGSSSLSWNVSNATLVSINQGVGTVGSSGSTIVSPPSTTTYTLTASNANGSLTATALVQVSGEPYPSTLPVIEYFTASPPIISFSGSSLLRWSTLNATSVTIDNGIGPVASHGTMIVSPTYSTDYTLTAANAYGYTTRTLPIQVSGAPPPLYFAVTSVTANASPPSYSGPCPYQFNFSGIITVNGPGTVKYQWERSDYTSDAAQSVTFSSAGSTMVTTYWYTGAPGMGWERLHILSPNDTISNQAYFILNCL